MFDAIKKRWGDEDAGQSEAKRFLMSHVLGAQGAVESAQLIILLRRRGAAVSGGGEAKQLIKMERL